MPNAAICLRVYGATCGTALANCARLLPLGLRKAMQLRARRLSTPPRLSPSVRPSLPPSLCPCACADFACWQAGGVASFDGAGGQSERDSDDARRSESSLCQRQRMCVCTASMSAFRPTAHRR
eukprot:2262935-Rhodomonas_salina.1